MKSHLADTVKRIPKNALSWVKAIHIIDDGSNDGTYDIACKLSKSDNRVIPHKNSENLGYGPTVQKGIELCLSDQVEVIVCLHGDGQYSPEYMLSLVDKVSIEEYDLVQGSRHADGTALEGGMPRYKYVAGKVLTYLENMAFGLSQTDYHSGYLAYSSRALMSLPFDQLSKSFDFDLELIACSRAAGLKIGEVGIPTIYADEESNLNPINYGFRVLNVIFKYLTRYYHRLVVKD